MNSSTASEIAISALTFLVSDEKEMARFLDLTGIDPSQIQQIVDTKAFQTAILDHLMRDEPVLLAFAASEGVDPGLIGKARYTLSPDDERQ